MSLDQSKIATGPNNHFSVGMTVLLLSWALLTALGCFFGYRSARIELAPEPSPAAQSWALASLQRLRQGLPLLPPPADVKTDRSAGPFFITAWWQGSARAHYQAPTLVHAVRGATDRFSRDRALTALAGWPPSASPPVLFTISYSRGTGSLWEAIPFISNIALVPMLEGVVAELGSRRIYLPPEKLWSAKVYESAVQTPIADLTFGVDLYKIGWQLAGQLGVSRDYLYSRGKVRRFRASLISAEPYPASYARLDSKSLRDAAREGARFLLRHQQSDGRFTYLYNAGLGQPVESDDYSLPRHAGTIFFLAQAGRLLGMPEARTGALRGLDWIRQNAVQHCGAPDRPCIGTDLTPNVGSSALTALAAAEILLTEDVPWVRELSTGLTRFIRFMQRPDGELKHVYDQRTRQPVDIQRMYYSGEAAFALFHSYRVSKNHQDLEVAIRLMSHLTGAAWSFFGSRYYYGEEHWTCHATAAAAQFMKVPQALDFCERWCAYNQKLQYRDTSPWPIRGAYGVGPVLLPRLTPVSSRTEAAISTFRVARAYGHNTAQLRQQIEAGLDFIVRYRWAPGPNYLFYHPDFAYGGIPGSPVDLAARNDFVQHAGTAMLLWAELKQQFP
jgi:hypothetical protein